MLKHTSKYKTSFMNIEIALKYFAICIMAFLFYACPPKCLPQLIVISPIPDSVLNMVPYVNNQEFSLKHSGGTIVNYTCSRLIRTDFVDCYRGCCTKIEYEIDQTLIKPDYPLPEISITISKSDEEFVDMSLSYSSSWFAFWLSDEDAFVVPSFENDGIIYNDVWALKAHRYDGYLSQPELYPDSLYYNAEFGVIKITMSNGETLSYYESNPN